MQQEMIEWLLDCYSEEHDQEIINNLSYTELKRIVNREYAGGVDAFADVLLNFELSSMSVTK